MFGCSPNSATSADSVHLLRHSIDSFHNSLSVNQSIFGFMV